MSCFMKFKVNLEPFFNAFFIGVIILFIFSLYYYYCFDIYILNNLIHQSSRYSIYILKTLVMEKMERVKNEEDIDCLCFDTQSSR